MSYTMFDRMGDAVYEALEGELDREVIERIWGDGGLPHS